MSLYVTLWSVLFIITSLKKKEQRMVSGAHTILHSIFGSEVSSSLFNGTSFRYIHVYNYTPYIYIYIYIHHILYIYIYIYIHRISSKRRRGYYSFQLYHNAATIRGRLLFKGGYYSRCGVYSRKDGNLGRSVNVLNVSLSTYLNIHPIMLILI